MEGGKSIGSCVLFRNNGCPMKFQFYYRQGYARHATLRFQDPAVHAWGVWEKAGKCVSKEGRQELALYGVFIRIPVPRFVPGGRASWPPGSSQHLFAAYVTFERVEEFEFIT